MLVPTRSRPTIHRSPAYPKISLLLSYQNPNRVAKLPERLCPPAPKLRKPSWWANGDFLRSLLKDGPELFFSSSDMAQIYPNLFRLLWYSFLPYIIQIIQTRIFFSKIVVLQVLSTALLSSARSRRQALVESLRVARQGRPYQISVLCSFVNEHNWTSKYRYVE